MTLHSPLGASSSERWMKCPGSVELLKYIGDLTESDEPDYRRDGTAAHELAATCLEMGSDPWEYAGQPMSNDVVVDLVMVECVAVYVDAVRAAVAASPEGKLYVEYGISSPIHPLFYGTLDAAQVALFKGHLFDYKHGVGVTVEVEHNPQFMYYCYGLLEFHPNLTEFEITVVQPRSFHPDGPVRTWTVSAEEIRTWAREVLVPAMNRTELDKGLDAGEWCRFCPAKLVCPLLTGLYRAAAVANPLELPNLTPEMLGLHYRYMKAVDFYKKALQEEVFNRLASRKEVPGTKLVDKKADRVWSPGAGVVFKSKFGDAAFTQLELKSPAQMEKIDPVAKDLVHQYSYTPKTGLTVALASDKAPEVKPQSLSETFAGALKNDP